MLAVQPGTSRDHLVASGTSIRCSFFFPPRPHQTNCLFFTSRPNVLRRSKTATEPKIATQAHQSDTWEFPHCFAKKEKKKNRWSFCSLINPPDCVWPAAADATFSASRSRSHPRTCSCSANYFHKCFRCSELLNLCCVSRDLLRDEVMHCFGSAG